MPKIQCSHVYNDIISHENLLAAWKEFLCGKKSKKDVQEFQLNLIQNIDQLHRDLVGKTYRHSEYEAFSISDPKPRQIHKATVRDRLLHHAIYRKLYPFFDRTFISDSFSCRRGKGMHKALKRFRTYANKTSLNYTKQIWILKCDIRKFFASVDQKILLEIMQKYIPDKDIVLLISQVVVSFHSTAPDVGLPLGNLTSQLLVNIYMNEFDQFVKHKLKIKYYIRYADDFVIFSRDKQWLQNLIPQLKQFLKDRLNLELHPRKVTIKTLSSGVDYLGWIHFPDHRVLRTVTKNRMMYAIQAKKAKTETVQSYLGILRHGNSTKLKGQVNTLVEQIEDSNGKVKMNM